MHLFKYDLVYLHLKLESFSLVSLTYIDIFKMNNYYRLILLLHMTIHSLSI
jgi:hypothetical protein